VSGERVRGIQGDKKHNEQQLLRSGDRLEASPSSADAPPISPIGAPAVVPTAVPYGARSRQIHHQLKFMFCASQPSIIKGGPRVRRPWG